MAKSPTHKLGQIIGDLLERAMEKPLQQFVAKHPRLYLDKKGHRPARGSKKKVSWKDKYGNEHDLDVVIEWGGTMHKIGKPAAFIEIAWRRYTKHSRNKAQEIQGAISPLLETYSGQCPFAGVILGGVFTAGSLTQLQSLRFQILYFNYETILSAFSAFGLDVSFNESTPDVVAQQKVDDYNRLSPLQINQIEEKLRQLKENELNEFITALERTVMRSIEYVVILGLHGQQHKAATIIDAISYINNYDLKNRSLNFVKFEIIIKYNNGDKVEASFKDRKKAVEFLTNINYSRLK